MSKGGFDVVIGNPPFVEYRKVVNDYRVMGLATLDCGNLCYFVCERAVNLLKRDGYWSLITPVASIASDRTSEFRSILSRGFLCWISSFSNRPAKLFDGVEQRIAIFVSKNSGRAVSDYYSSDFYHWYSDERPFLFARLSYVQIVAPNSSSSLPKAGTDRHVSVLTKVKSVNGLLARFLRPTRRSNQVIYYHNGVCLIDWWAS